MRLTGHVAGMGSKRNEGRKARRKNTPRKIKTYMVG
jgi:hypothetical protein